MDKYINMILAHNDEVYSLRSRTIDELEELVLHFYASNKELIEVLEFILGAGLERFDLIGAERAIIAVYRAKGGEQDANS